MRLRVRVLVRVRVCVCVSAHARRHTCVHAETCREHFPSARIICGSARRRSAICRRSTRTSARGTLPRCQTCPRYAPISASGVHRGGRAQTVFDAPRPYMRIFTYTRVCLGRHAPWHASECACIQPRFPMRACVSTYQRKCTHTPTRAHIEGTREPPAYRSKCTHTGRRCTCRSIQGYIGACVASYT